MFTYWGWIVMQFWIAGGLVGLRCYFAVGMFEALLIGLASEARIAILWNWDDCGCDPVSGSLCPYAACSVPIVGVSQSQCNPG